MICPASGPNAPKQPDRCDDTEYGKGTGGQLQYDVRVPRGGRTVWFSVGGSDQGLDQAAAAQRNALAHPAASLRAKIDARNGLARNTRVDLPGDRLLQRSVEWSKQNLAESVQESRDLKVRITNAGKNYPAPIGTVAKARWFGAGFPDYPWLFATDGEYTGFAAVSSGQFATIKAHLRALRDVSVAANGQSGKVVHEVTPDGQVYFGANSDAGNTDETAKFPSIVALVWRWTGDDAFRDEMYPFAVRNLRYVYRELDADGDGWPEGLGNVETPGMGTEKLDNTVYTIRGLRDLADLAASKGDTATRTWATDKATDLEKRFEAAWWNGADTQQYADSLQDPGNVQVFQRHWIGVTPAEVELKRPGQPDGPLASEAHARALVERREQPCYTGEFGLFHTGSGRTAPTTDTEGPACDTAVSSVPALRNVFTLNTSIMAAAEAALGRMGPGQLEHYTTGSARTQLDPSVWELPGAMPEIAPSPDFGSNQAKLFTERSMVLQAWGAYGILWPVVHYQLGISPDLGRGLVAVVPQVPDGQPSVSASHVRLGSGSVDVRASRAGSVLRTVVRAERPLAVAHRCRAARRSPRAVGAAGREGARLPPRGHRPRSDRGGRRWQRARDQRAGGAAALRLCRRGHWAGDDFSCSGQWCPPRRAHGSPGCTTRPGHRHAQARLLRLAAVQGRPVPQPAAGDRGAFGDHGRDGRGDGHQGTQGQAAPTRRGGHARASRPGG